MYLQHFGLHEKPFRVVPSPRMLFVSETHDESRARILYGIRESRGFVVVTGGIGLGKTTVLLSVLDDLAGHVRTALIFHPVDTFKQLLRLMADEFGFKIASRESEATLLQKLNQFLLERMADGDTCVLLIDEAQNLSMPVLERIRTLSNLQTEEASLLQIVLVGQPELQSKLDDSRLLQLRQRVGVWHEILPLSFEEGRNYIWHRLRLCGGQDPEQIFSARICERIAERAHGIPRLINQICDTGMVIAYGRDETTIGPEIVEEAAVELRLVPKSSSPTMASEATRPSPRTPTPVRRRDSLRRWWRNLPWTLRRWRGSREGRVGLAAWPWPAILLAGGMTIGLGIWSSDLLHDALHGSGLAGAFGRRGVGDSNLVISASGAPGEGATAGDEALRSVVLEQGGDSEGSAAADSALARRYEQVRQWRQSSVPIYAVHLRSFRDRGEMNRFVGRLISEHPQWNEPFFSERSIAGGTTWHRLLVGAFLDRADARAWFLEGRGRWNLDYGQVDLLSSDAEPMTLLREARASMVGTTGAGG